MTLDSVSDWLYELVRMSPYNERCMVRNISHTNSNFEVEN